jgi:hypothetical protein
VRKTPYIISRALFSIAILGLSRGMEADDGDANLETTEGEHSAGTGWSYKSTGRHANLISAKPWAGNAPPPALPLVSIRHPFMHPFSASLAYPGCYRVAASS